MKTLTFVLTEDNRELASNFVLFHSRVKSYVKQQTKGENHV